MRENARENRTRVTNIETDNLECWIRKGSLEEELDECIKVNRP